MEESEVFQAAVMQGDIQATTVAVMVLREVNTGSISGACMASTVKACRHRHGRPASRQPSFDWSPQECLSFEIQVMNGL